LDKKNFLVGREQFVKIADACSSVCHHHHHFICAVISGVPQGSVPVLLILYVNDDIVDCIVPGITVKLFADDTKLYTAFDALVKKLPIVCSRVVPSSDVQNTHKKYFENTK